MTELPTYDVAVIGYGPTGATAANLLGQLGLKVVVIERDPDVYNRARAISTDEEVMRIWQSIGLAERLQADMLPDRPLTVRRRQRRAVHRDEDRRPRLRASAAAVPVPARGRPRAARGRGALRRTSRCCSSTNACACRPRATRSSCCWPICATDTFKRLSASYVIAADGGSSPTRGQLGVGYSGRTYAERWVVIDTKVRKEWDGHDRLRFHCNPDRPTVDCPTPLGHHRWEYPGPRRRGRTGLCCATTRSGRSLARRASPTNTSRSCAR